MTELESIRGGVLIGGPSPRVRHTVFLDPDEKKAVARESLRTPTGGMGQIRELMQEQRSRWGAQMQDLRLSGVPMMGEQWFHELQGGTGSGRGLMIADQTAVTGTADVLLWPMNAATSPYTTIAANEINHSQKVIQVTAGGVSTTPASAATTMTCNPRWGTSTGGVTLGISRASATAIVSLTAVPWMLSFRLVFRVASYVATSATCTGNGVLECDTIGTSSTNPSGAINFGGTSATVDTTTAQGICMTVVLGGSASWTMTTKWVTMEYLN